MNGPCPILDLLLHELCRSSNVPLYEAEHDAFLKLRLNHRANDWAPVLETRAFTMLLTANWLVVRSLSASYFDGEAESYALLRIGWADAEGDAAIAALERSKEPAQVITTDHKLKGSPRNLHQLTVEAADTHIRLVDKTLRLAQQVQATMQKIAIWPPLMLGAQFHAVLTEARVPLSTCAAYVERLFSITPENQFIWRSKTTASLALP